MMLETSQFIVVKKNTYFYEKIYIFNLKTLRSITSKEILKKHWLFNNAPFKFCTQSCSTKIIKTDFFSLFCILCLKIEYFDIIQSVMISGQIFNY